MTAPNAKRLPPDERRANILAAAVCHAVQSGYLNLTRDSVATAANVSPGLVSRYFYTSQELRHQVMYEAIRLEILPVILDGLASRCPVAQSAPRELRAAAFELAMRGL